MRCKQCEESLLEYLYGELDAAEASRMERHLEESEPCREICRNFKATLDLVSHQVEEPFPEVLRSRIMAHAEEFADDERARKRPWARLFRPVLTTALVAVVAAGVYLYSLRTREAFEAKSPAVVGDSRVQLFREAPPPTTGKPEEPLPEDSPAPDKKRETVVAGLLEKDEALRQEAQGRGGPLPQTPGPAPAAEGEPASRADRKAAARPAVPSPGALQKSRELAAEGRCGDALPLVEAWAAGNPEEDACGLAWLDVGRCFAREGDSERASEAARKALAYPAHAEEAAALIRGFEVGAEAP